MGGGHPRQRTALKGLPVVDLGPARAARFDRRTPARLGEFHPQAPKIRKGGQAPCRRVARLWFVKTETRSYYEAAVERAVARIVRSLDEALDLSVLAREAALSTFHFQRVFRGMLGETPIEMPRRLRLERAAAQLIEQDLAVTTIAFAAGYETHEGFTRAFRQAYGGSPSSFRQQASGLDIGCSRLPSIELAAPSGVHYRSQHLTIRFAGGESAMDVTIEDMPELRVAAVRHLGPYSRISEAFARLGALAGPAGLVRPPDTMMLAIYYDEPETTPAAELRSDAGLTVPEGARLPEGLTEQRLAAGRYARFTHVGPYEGLPDAWARLMGHWLPKSGHRVGSGLAFEVYRNDPRQVAPEALRTDLYLSIA